MGCWWLKPETSFCSLGLTAAVLIELSGAVETPVS